MSAAYAYRLGDRVAVLDPHALRWQAGTVLDARDDRVLVETSKRLNVVSTLLVRARLLGGAVIGLENGSGVPTDERYTPEHVLEVVRAFAPIGLDPCAPPSNPTRAAWFLTIKEDGLTALWSCAADQCVFVNPPYSRGLLDAWAAKVTDVAASDCTIDMIVLTPCDLGTKWAGRLWKRAQAFAGWRGRISFVRPDGSYETGAKQSSLFWYFGERVERFRRVFAPYANGVSIINR